MCLNLMERKTRYLIDHGHTLRGLLPAGAAEFREEDGEQDVNEIMSTHESASSEVVLLEEASAQTYRTGVVDECITNTGPGRFISFETVQGGCEGWV